MAAKKSGFAAAEERREKVDKAEKRVLLLARRWARHAETFTVLNGPSFHLLRAIQKLEKLP